MFRKNLSPKQFDHKLALSFGAVVLLLILTATGVASSLYLRLQEEEENRLAGAIATILSESISRVAFSGKYHTRFLLEEMMIRVPELASISVENSDGIILAHSDSALNDTRVSAEDNLLALQSLNTKAAVLREHRVQAGIVKEVVLPYTAGFDNGISGVVRVGVRVEAARRAQRVNLLKLLVLVTVLTAAAIAVVYLLSRHFGGSMRALGWQLKGIMDHAPLGIAISNRSGDLLMHSAELEKMTGLPESGPLEPVGLAHQLPASASLTLLEMDSQVRGDSLKIVREMTLETEGRRRFWDVSKFPTAMGDAGEVTLICTLIHDITERKLAEISLQESEERYRNIFEGANDAIIILDGFSIIGCNNKAISLFECEWSDLLGCAIHTISPEYQPDGQSSHSKSLRIFEKVTSGEPTVFEWLHATLNGRIISTEVSLSAITLGTTTRTQAIIRDITQRKEAEEQLRQSEEKFSKVFELAPDCILITRLSDGVVLSVNTIFDSMTGFNREEIIGKSTADLHLWAILQERNDFYTQLRATGRVDNFDFKLLTKEHSLRNLSVSAQLIVLSGETCVLSVVRDVTESVKMKEVMIQTEKMMSIGGLAAGMAHEINNPLGGILQSVQVIQRRLTVDSKANHSAAENVGCTFSSIRNFLEAREILTLLQGVRDAGFRAARIVSNMLEFSRKNESIKAPTNLPELLDRAVELCAHDYDLTKKYDFRKIVIERHYDPNLPDVPCTATQIDRC